MLHPFLEFPDCIRMIFELRTNLISGNDGFETDRQPWVRKYDNDPWKIKAWLCQQESPEFIFQSVNVYCVIYSLADLFLD